MRRRVSRPPQCTQLRLPSPYAKPPFTAADFITHAVKYDPAVPANIRLVCGDPLLERLHSGEVVMDAA